MHVFALVGSIHVAEVHGQHDVLDTGEHGQELEELEDDADVAPAPLGHGTFAQVVDGRAVDEDLAARGPVDAGDHVDERGFAAAGFADHGDELAGADAQVDVAQGNELADRAFGRLCPRRGAESGCRCRSVGRIGTVFFGAVACGMSVVGGLIDSYLFITQNLANCEPRCARAPAQSLPESASTRTTPSHSTALPGRENVGRRRFQKRHTDCQR